MALVPLMGLYLRLVIGPVVVCDIDLFRTVQSGPGPDDPPPQLTGGSGMLNEPWIGSQETTAFGFDSGAATRRNRGTTAV